jgi:D-alanine-D-alanine ligase
MRKLRIAVLMHDYLVPPDDVTGIDLLSVTWKTEHDVLVTLREMGHDVRPVAIKDDLTVIRRAVEEFKPHIAVNRMENFHESGAFDHNIVSYLELLRVPYTGCNPRGLMLARDKALSKTLLSYHRIPVPDFVVVHVGRKPRRPKRLAFPLIVKPLTEEASIGISQASVVEDEDRMRERVAFIHSSVGTDAIIERYVDGRELYVGIIGNQRLRVLPVWELHFTKMPDDVHRIATERVKWSPKYQRKYGIKTREARRVGSGRSAAARPAPGLAAGLVARAPAAGCEDPGRPRASGGGGARRRLGAVQRSLSRPKRTGSTGRGRTPSSDPTELCSPVARPLSRREPFRRAWPSDGGGLQAGVEATETRCRPLWAPIPSCARTPGPRSSHGTPGAVAERVARSSAHGTQLHPRRPPRRPIRGCGRAVRTLPCTRPPTYDPPT